MYSLRFVKYRRVCKRGRDYFSYFVNVDLCEYFESRFRREKRFLLFYKLDKFYVLDRF